MLCGGNASQRSLRVDDFPESVREELELKAILVGQNLPSALPSAGEEVEGGAWCVKCTAEQLVGSPVGMLALDGAVGCCLTSSAAFSRQGAADEARW